MFATQDQGNRRAGARGLTRNHGSLARGLHQAAVGAVCAAAVALPLISAAGAEAATSAPHALTSSWTSLALHNGWSDYGFGTAGPAVKNISGIVHFKGAIATQGTNQVPFTLPVGDRPGTEVAVPVDQSGATVGTLDLQPSGVVTVEAEDSNWSNAQLLTSLDGASFATSGNSFTKLTLTNGWINYAPPMASAAVRSISGIVHFRGAVMTEGSGVMPFILPTAFRPAHTVYVPVDLCGSSNGRLDISPSGEVDVEAENGPQWIPQCPVSLDGAWFAKSASLYTPLTLQNGWISYGSGTISPAVRKINGIVHFEGAMYNGANSQAFTLPVGFRPSHYVYVSVDTNVATRGHIVIAPDGQVNVIGEGTQSDATLFTSLDGVSFAT